MDEKTEDAPARMPVGFVGHGAPTLALDMDKGSVLTRWATGLPRPRAVLVLSAHWERAPISIGATAHAEPLYDFYGFPDAYYRIAYAPPGAPTLADRVEALLEEHAEVARVPRRALDHGAWVPLLHMWADASVPVLQVSMPRSMTPEALFRLGDALSPLRDEGVFLLGSGNVTHNLRELRRGPDGPWSDGGGDAPPAWAAEFDAWLSGRVSARDWDALIKAPDVAPGFSTAHPTPDHFRPLLVAAGAAKDTDGVRFPVIGFEYGSLSRRSIELA